jgi:gag-polypeptide of LTR copia-type
MTDLNTIRVIPFCGKADDWPIWSEIFLSKAKRYGLKDLLLGKLSIPRSDEEFEVTSEIGTEKSRIIELNEIAFTELILLIDVKTSSGKTAFNLVKGCKTKDHPDGNAARAWERLKNKYEPVSAPTLVKLEKQFRELSFKKGQDPETWITELEDLCARLETMESSILENQFIIHILNNLTSEYELQLAIMERRVGDTDWPLSVEEIRGELSLRFERLNSNSTNTSEGELLEEQALFCGQFKGKCRNCGLIGHKSFQCKNRAINNGGNNSNSSGGIFCSYCRKSGHDKKNSLKLKKKEVRNNNPSNNSGNGNRQNYESQDVVFTATSQNGTLSNDIWICDSGACGHYCKSIEGMFNLKDIAETITVGNGSSMMATKVGSLMRCIVQLNGSTLDIIINEVKYVPNLCANLHSINKAIKNGFNLRNNGTSICLTKGSASITFDRIINTLSGSISGIKIIHTSLLLHMLQKASQS